MKSRSGQDSPQIKCCLNWRDLNQVPKAERTQEIRLKRQQQPDNSRKHWLQKEHQQKRDHKILIERENLSKRLTNQKMIQ